MIRRLNPPAPRKVSSQAKRLHALLNALAKHDPNAAADAANLIPKPHRKSPPKKKDATTAFQLAIRENTSDAARQMLLFSAPDVHYLFNAYNRAVHSYNEEVEHAASGLGAPAAPSTKHLDKARADFLAAVEALPHGQVRDAYMDEFNATHVLRYNAPSMRALDKKVKVAVRKRHALKSGVPFDPHTVCQDCGQEDALIVFDDGHLGCFMCGAPQSSIETRHNAPSKRRKNTLSNAQKVAQDADKFYKAFYDLGDGLVVKCMTYFLEDRDDEAISLLWKTDFSKLSPRGLEAFLKSVKRLQLRPGMKVTDPAVKAYIREKLVPWFKEAMVSARKIR